MPSLALVFPGDGAGLAVQIPPKGWETLPGCPSPGGLARISAAICHAGNCSVALS